MVKRFFKNHPVHKKIVPLFDYLFLIRPIYLLTVWLIIGAGMTAALLQFDPPKLWSNSFTGEIVLFIVSLSVLFAGCFVHWQNSSDSGYPLQATASLLNVWIKPEISGYISIILLSAGLVGIVLVNYILVIPCIFIIVILGPPRITNADNLSHFEFILAGIILVLTSYIFMMNEINLNFTQISIGQTTLPYLFILIAVGILLPIERYGNTESVKNKKEMTRLSEFRVKFIIASMLCIFSIITGLKFQDPVSSTCALTMLPFFVVLTLRSNRVDLVRTVRYSILINSVFIYSVYPGFIWFAVAIYFLSKYYYWHRFNIHFPTLVIEYDSYNRK